MKYCPECGNLLDNNKCNCGFVYEPEEKQDNEKQPYLFSEPGMREMNDPYKQINIPKQPYYADEIFQSMHSGMKNMVNNQNLTEEDLIKTINDKHYTA